MRLAVIEEVDDISLKEFDCGEPSSNSYLFKYAKTNSKTGIEKTYFLFEKEGKNIVGYYTLAYAQISYENKPLETDYDNLPKYPIPSIRIARLAVAKKYQHKNNGSELLKSALSKCVSSSEIAGALFVIVDAKEKSQGFYEHYGFKQFSDNKLTYFIDIRTVKIAMQEQ
jgi:predicted GNAT family N-acyltransferase